MKRGQTQVVTGLSVFDQTPRISRKVKNKIRTACFYTLEFLLKGLIKTVSWCSIIELEGLLNFYSKIEPEFIEKMRYLKRTGKYK